MKYSITEDESTLNWIIFLLAACFVCHFYKRGQQVCKFDFVFAFLGNKTLPKWSVHLRKDSVPRGDNSFFNGLLGTDTCLSIRYMLNILKTKSYLICHLDEAVCPIYGNFIQDLSIYRTAQWQFLACQRNKTKLSKKINAKSDTKRTLTLCLRGLLVVLAC